LLTSADFLRVDAPWGPAKQAHSSLDLRIVEQHDIEQELCTSMLPL
jgi:hypothetical protein